MSSVDVVALSPMLIKESRNRCKRFPNRNAGSCSPKDSCFLVHLNILGFLTPLRVLESDTIASVKLRIQACQMFAAENQKLVYCGRELSRNDSLVKDYGIRNGNVLHLTLKNSDVLLIIVTSYCGAEYELHVHRNRNVAYVKQRLSTKCREEQEIFFDGAKLDNEKRVDEICSTNVGTIHLFAKLKTYSLDKTVHDEKSLMTCSSDKGVHDEKSLNGIQWKPRFDSIGGNLDGVVKNMVTGTFEGLARGKPPVMSSEGSGGTYFMQDPNSHGFISVFKPTDEEPNAVNNPRGFLVAPSEEGLKKGTRVGEGAIREVAAFILDHPINGPRKCIGGKVSGFAGVPPTVIVKCLHSGFNFPKGFRKSEECVKIGSLQLFVKNEGSCEDIGPASFPVEEVHKISVLDIRMANADRHAGNILMRKDEKGQISLIPIDHGYCLPESFEDCTFEWMNWPQSHRPYSPKVVRYVQSLDAEADIALLRSYGWDIPTQSARTLRISTMLLKKGVAKGLTPFQIGQLMCRDASQLNQMSAVEQIAHQAQSSLLTGFHETQFLQTISILMDAKLSSLST